eukprot:GHVU01115737.1.p1 GENE.GHVU01115737.1~~GHVU01115737.1.p1  ORF type:complete len:118 (+),score=7.93 GHVU01115737.1:85-438(+)
MYMNIRTRTHPFAPRRYMVRIHRKRPAPERTATPRRRTANQLIACKLEEALETKKCWDGLGQGIANSIASPLEKRAAKRPLLRNGALFEALSHSIIQQYHQTLHAQARANVLERFLA